eukprot:2196167-Amphidinium_carterae.1
MGSPTPTQSSSDSMSPPDRHELRLEASRKCREIIACWAFGSAGVHFHSSKRQGFKKAQASPECGTRPLAEVQRPFGPSVMSLVGGHPADPQMQMQDVVSPSQALL